MNASKIRIKERYDYVQRLKVKLSGSGHILTGQIDITYYCNLNCQHCFVVREQKKRELGFEEIISIIDTLYEAGCLWLTFSGGEPFLRDDFLDIYTYARKKGFLITIFTNGTLINQRIVDYLANLPPYCIEITINGITKDIYEEITQVEGSFKKAMEAIAMLKEKKLPLVFKCNGLKINYSQILKIKEFTESLLGKERFRCDLIVSARMDGSKKPLDLRLTPEEILKIEHSDQDMSIFCREQFLHQKENCRLKDGYLFSCSPDYFYIDPYGYLRLCSIIQEMYIDLKKENFLKGLVILYSKLSQAKFKTHTKCRDCKISSLCNQCPGWALIENADMEIPVEFFCELARRKEEMREEVLATRISARGERLPDEQA